MDPSKRADRLVAGLGRLLVVTWMAWVAIAALGGLAQRANAADPSSSPSSSQAPGPAGDPSAPIYVVTADGIVDNVMAGYIDEALTRAAESSSPAVVVMLNTPGGSLDATQRIVSSLLESPVPAIVWVAPSGGHAASAGTFITLAANLAYMAPGTNIGAASPVGPPNASTADTS